MSSDLKSLLQTVSTRRSIRRFLKDPIAESLLHEVLDAARYAPCAGNRHQFRIVKIFDREKLSSMADAVREASAAWCERTPGSFREDVRAYSKNFTFFEDAPVVLFFISRGGRSIRARF